MMLIYHSSKEGEVSCNLMYEKWQSPEFIERYKSKKIKNKKIFFNLKKKKFKKQKKQKNKK